MGALTRTTAIFSKRPVAGAVKTRLCPPLSPEEAARLAAAMLADTIARCAAHRGFATALLYAPAGDAGWFRARFPELADQRAQVGAGLAERLAAFFDGELAAGGRTAVAIGSDAPLVSAALLVEAHERLERGAELVLGPDLGGGYYLVGLRRPCAELFTEVTMSTDDMCERTRRLARARGLSVELLTAGYDVDVEADLERLRRDLASGAGAPDPPRRTAAVLLELETRSRP